MWCSLIKFFIRRLRANLRSFGEGFVMELSGFKSEVIYKVLYSEGDELKTPKGKIVSCDSDFITILFRDGRVKLVNVKNIISITELGDDCEI